MGIRELFGRVRGEVWIDGSRALVIRDAEVAATMQRPTTEGAEHLEPCDRCSRPFEERLLTTGTQHGDPEVWDAVPVAVDGWACATCAAVRYPRAMSAQTSVRYGKAGVAAVEARNWREAEWWFTRIVWAWPGYGPGYLDLATALGARLASGFDTQLAARRRVARRMQQAYDDAIDAIERERERTRADARVAVYLGAAEAAAGDRSAARARRILDRLAARETLDAAAEARAHEIRSHVDEERWIFGDASEVLRPHLQLQDAAPTPIGAGEQRRACVGAVERLEAFHAAHPAHWQSIWMAAMGRAALGEREATLARWREAWQAHPERPEIVREAALAFLRVDRVAEALEINRDATARVPDDATLWCNRAVTELLSGDLGQARECVRESRRLDPADPIARALSGRLAELRPEGPLPRTLAELEGRARR